MSELGSLFDRSGKQIGMIEWTSLRKTPAYRYVRRYKNKGGYWAEVQWIGHGLKPYLFVVNGAEQGTQTEQQAIDLFEHTLVAAGHAEWLNNGAHFVAPENLFENITTRTAVLEAMVDNPNFGTW